MKKDTEPVIDELARLRLLNQLLESALESSRALTNATEKRLRLQSFNPVKEVKRHGV